MSRTRLKQLLAVLVLLATAAGFAYYFTQHPETFRQLGELSPATLLFLLGLYAVFMAALTWIQWETLAVSNLVLKRKESILLSMYSSIINFFGPLQSGPGFRAAYLKKKHDINLKQFTLATLLYYGFYAVFSCILLLAAFIGWWAIPLCLVVLGLVPIVLLPASPLRRVVKGLRVERIGVLAAASLAQVLAFSVIFFAELHGLDPDISYSQALVYTGAANLALFVSLTPGAIGFRESFLLLSQQLHGIDSPTILAASLIDRSVYVLFLGILAIITTSMHASNYLQMKRPRTKL